MAASQANSGQTDHERERGLVQDLDALRKLTVQLRRGARSADDHVLRAILGKRETLLTAIGAQLAAEADAAAASIHSEDADAVARRRLIADIVAEVHAMDRETAAILKERADDLGAEIRNLRAGRKWRESSQSWT